MPFLGGGFGRRNFTDFLVQAAVIAREADGAPVPTIRSREQDMTDEAAPTTARSTPDTPSPTRASHIKPRSPWCPSGSGVRLPEAYYYN
jgi:hypothetical protein